MTDTVAVRRLLLVEDDTITALAEKALLERAGFAVTRAATGEQAVEAVGNGESFDLILMDIDLGSGIDGTEAATRILALRELPLVFLSGHIEPDIVAQTEGITSYGYVVKNTGETVLLASIRMAFRLFDANRRIAMRTMEIAAANEQLRVTNDKLDWWQRLMEYIVQHDPSAIAVLDRDLRFMYVSDRFLSDYRVAQRDVIGKHHYDVFPEIPEKWRTVHQRGLGGETLRCDHDTFERPDGTIDSTRWECRPWYDRSGSIGGIVLYTEVLSARAAEPE